MIDASKDGVKFACQGDIGNGAVTLRSHQNVEKEDLNVDIELSEPVSLTFSLKYLVNFCKASALATRVKICLSNEVPLLVEYSVQGNSWLRFYLAPKVRVFLSVLGWFLSLVCMILTCLGFFTDWRRGVNKRRQALSNTFSDCHTPLPPPKKKGPRCLSREDHSPWLGLDCVWYYQKKDRCAWYRLEYMFMEWQDCLHFFYHRDSQSRGHEQIVPLPRPRYPALLMKYKNLDSYSQRFLN